MAAPVSLVPGRPTKLPAPAASQTRPGVTPCTGVAGEDAQAASNAGARRSALRIDSLLLLDDEAAHLELAVLDREREAALDQIERVLAEFLIAPARENLEVLADSGRERLELVGAGDELGGHPGFLGADLEQQLQQVADQH